MHCNVGVYNLQQLLLVNDDDGVSVENINLLSRMNIDGPSALRGGRCRFPWGTPRDDVDAPAGRWIQLLSLCKWKLMHVNRGHTRARASGALGARIHPRRVHDRGFLARTPPPSSYFLTMCPTAHWNVFSVPPSVWTVPFLCSWKFWKIQDFSTPTGSWWSLRRDRIQLPVGVEIEFFKIFMNIGTELSTLSIGHSII